MRPEGAPQGAPPVGRGNRGKRFVFTLNNYTESEWNLAENGDYPCLTHLIVAQEVGESGTPHLQGYLEFKDRVLVTQVRRRVPFLSRAAIFVAKGTRRQNFDYCTKQNGLRREIGDFGAEVTRSDLQRIRELIDAGVPELEIAEKYFSRWCTYRRAFREYRDLRCTYSLSSLRTNLEVIVYFGPPGSGKTRRVYEEEKELYVWPGGRWFDGYVGQEAVLFDDYDGSQIPFRLLLRVIDIYPITLEVKGGHIYWYPKRIYFTSNVAPQNWYEREDFAPLQRRFTRVERVVLDAGGDSRVEHLGAQPGAAEL